MVKKRRRHMAAYKFRVAQEALEGSKTISQLSSEHEIHANLIRAWKRQLLEGGPSVFASNGERKQRDQEEGRRQNFMNRSGGSRWKLSG